MDDESKELEVAKPKPTQAELQEIWDQTTYLSAQTPLEIRRAIIALKSFWNPFKRRDAFVEIVLGQMMDIRAAMTGDANKFAHLVAGTETIVKTLQAVNPLGVKFSETNSRIERLESALELINLKLDAIMNGRDHIVVNVPDSEPSDAIEGIPDEEQNANDARKATIGSAWAKP